MSRTTFLDQLFAFTHYLSWADLEQAVFEEELEKEVDTQSSAAVHEHEWRWFGLLSHWYASLNVVVEAWDELKFSDPVIDRLLAAGDMRHLLQRYRNAVMHFQDSLITPKLLELLREGETHVYWVHALHYELVRFLVDYLGALVVTDDQKADLLEIIGSAIHWYPYHLHRKVASTERLLVNARELLSRSPDDNSEERRQLLFVEDSEAQLAEPRRNFEEFRVEMLRKLSIKRD